MNENHPDSLESKQKIENLKLEDKSGPNLRNYNRAKKIESINGAFELRPQIEKFLDEV